MEWSDTLLTGVECIDAEHMVLVKKAAEFSVALKSLIPKSDLLTSLHQMESAIRTHIRSEEEFLARIRYPRIRKHIKLHESLISNLQNMAGFIENNDVNPFTADFIAQATSTWLVDHIRLHDREIGVFSRAKALYQESAASCGV